MKVLSIGVLLLCLGASARGWTPGRPFTSAIVHAKGFGGMFMDPFQKVVRQDYNPFKQNEQENSFSENAQPFTKHSPPTDTKQVFKRSPKIFKNAWNKIKKMMGFRPKPTFIPRPATSATPVMAITDAPVGTKEVPMTPNDASVESTTGTSEDSSSDAPVESTNGATVESTTDGTVESTTGTTEDSSDASVKSTNGATVESTTGAKEDSSDAPVESTNGATGEPTTGGPVESTTGTTEDSSDAPVESTNATVEPTTDGTVQPPTNATEDSSSDAPVKSTNGATVEQTARASPDPTTDASP